MMLFIVIKKVHVISENSDCVALKNFEIRVKDEPTGFGKTLISERSHTVSSILSRNNEVARLKDLCQASLWNVHYLHLSLFASLIFWRLASLHFLVICLFQFSFILFFVEKLVFFSHLGLAHLGLVNPMVCICAYTISYTMDLRSRRDFCIQFGLHYERQLREKVVGNMLPPHLVDMLTGYMQEKRRPTFVVVKHCVSVLFADITGSTALSDKLPPIVFIRLLTSLFSTMDEYCEIYNVYKIKTIGDAFMAAKGLLEEMDQSVLQKVGVNNDDDNLDDSAARVDDGRLLEDASPSSMSQEELSRVFMSQTHPAAWAAQIVLFGLRLIKVFRRDLHATVRTYYSTNGDEVRDNGISGAKIQLSDTQLDMIDQIGLTVGVNTGSLYTGVLSYKRFQYDVFGKTVNLAARLESGCKKNHVHISENTLSLVSPVLETRVAKGGALVSYKGFEEKVRSSYVFGVKKNWRRVFKSRVDCGYLLESGS